MSDPQTTASLTDLKEALKDTLETRGVLGQIKARIRGEIFQSLEDKSYIKPKLSNENLIINELIREYLMYNHYQHSLSVLLAETGQPLESPFPRSFLAHELQVSKDPVFEQVPLLYSIIAQRQSKDRQSSDQKKNDLETTTKTEKSTPKSFSHQGNTQPIKMGKCDASNPSPVIFTKEIE